MGCREEEHVTSRVGGIWVESLLLATVSMAATTVLASVFLLSSACSPYARTIRQGFGSRYGVGCPRAGPKDAEFRSYRGGLLNVTADTTTRY